MTSTNLATLSAISMFGEHGPHKRESDRPTDVGQQCHTFGPVGLFMTCCNATLKSWPGAARHSLAYVRFPNSESHISSQVTAEKIAYSCNAEFVVSFCTLVSKISVRAPYFTEQGLIGFKSGPDRTSKRKPVVWYISYLRCSLLTLRFTANPRIDLLIYDSLSRMNHDRLTICAFLSNGGWYVPPLPCPSVLPRTPFGHICALIWSWVRGNIARTAL